MTRTTGIAIGTDITPTSITTGYLSLSTVSGGDSTRGITILTTTTAITLTIPIMVTPMITITTPHTTYDDQPGYSDSDQSAANATVSAVQAQLSKLGLYNGGIDGTLGDQTEAALARYQEDRDLSVTGTADAATLQSLGIK